MTADRAVLCDHPRAHKERILGADTGDYTCPDCHKTEWGDSWIDRDREANRKAREAKDDQR